MIVVDASVLSRVIADDTDEGDRARLRLRDEQLAAPELVDLEVLSVVRRAEGSGHLDDRRSSQALADLAAMPIARASHTALAHRIWELRHNVSAYDAAYVALAEAAGAPLVTFDERLARAAGVRCEIEILA